MVIFVDKWKFGFYEFSKGLGIVDKSAMDKMLIFGGVKSINQPHILDTDASYKKFC